VQVRIAVKPQQRRLRLSLPEWTPGSYLIRHYVRRLEGLELWQGDRRLALQRRAVAGWQAQLNSLEPIEIRYQLLAPELSVRTSQLTAEHAFLAMASVVLAIEGERWSAHRLSLELPEAWQPFVALPQQPDGSWIAADYDQLIDTPVEAGPHPCHRFELAGVPHRWVEWGGDLAREDPAWLGDLQQLCLACCRLMGVERPAADHYLFVLHRTASGYGGLEHDNGSVLQFGRRALAKPEGRRQLLQLVAHEYLHQWNVRRLRPLELATYDYDQAVVIPSLWFAEGVTSYLDQLLPHAAGLSGEAELLEDLGADLSRYLLTAGRQVQTLQASSEEAWVKLYLADAHSGSSQVSYYLKGAVLALVLDLRLRQRGYCLPLVLQQLWRSHGAIGRGYRQAELIAAFAAHDPELSELLPQWLNSTEDPPIAAALAVVGLRLQPEISSEPWLGWQLEVTNAGLFLQRLQRDSPAQLAGLLAGDELLALDGVRLRSPEDLTPLWAAAPWCQPRQLLWVRDGLVRSGEITAAAPAVQRWRLLVDPEAEPASAQRRASWLRLQRP
jgi:predicted metalloprotease with PDZ domain